MILDEFLQVSKQAYVHMRKHVDQVYGMLPDVLDPSRFAVSRVRPPPSIAKGRFVGTGNQRRDETGRLCLCRGERQQCQKKRNEDGDHNQGGNPRRDKREDGTTRKGRRGRRTDRRRREQPTEQRQDILCE